ncbi:uncharacterized protein LOC104887033 [Beta vulgaris subsp. vulgaris]|uniref:uncharacterized protein LOC104887033 n=1 Tax=Beta vulgaris subsp. vulgaris TaxID=3555 RepID=UPI00053F40A4|nr:uncharacterized protein LOC104887033 [Beta vulgaris subsp. vulgaris]
MVEVKFGDDLPEQIEFENENGVLTSQMIKYEWRPIKCDECGGVGHDGEACRMKKEEVQKERKKLKIKKVWVVKATVPHKVQTAKTSQEAQMGMQEGEVTCGVIDHLLNPLNIEIAAKVIEVNDMTKEKNVSDGQMENGNERAPQGLNSPWKHFHLRKFIQSQNVGLFGYLETRVKTGNFAKVYPRICPNWSIVTSYSAFPGGRIWLVWSPSCFTVDVRMLTEQMIYGVMNHKASGVQFCLSMVYGHNDKEKRSELWNDLIKCSRDVMNTQWVVMGDFNNILNLNERIGQPVLFSEIERFRNCVDSCGLGDAKMTGPFYTWSNKQQEDDYVTTKIDRVLVNGQWELCYPYTEAAFLLEGCYDHCPCIVKIHKELNKRAKPLDSSICGVILKGF